MIKPLKGERSLELKLCDYYQKRADSFFSRVVWTDEEARDHMQQLKHDKRKEVSLVATRVLEANQKSKKNGVN